MGKEFRVNGNESMVIRLSEVGGCERGEKLQEMKVIDNCTYILVALFVVDFFIIILVCCFPHQ